MSTADFSAALAVLITFLLIGNFHLKSSLSIFPVLKV